MPRHIILLVISHGHSLFRDWRIPDIQVMLVIDINLKEGNLMKPT